MIDKRIYNCECSDDCTAIIPADAYQSLDNWRAEFEDETGDLLKDSEIRLLAGFDHYITTADHVGASPVVQRYGAYCVVVKDVR